MITVQRVYTEDLKICGNQGLLLLSQNPNRSFKK